MSYSQLTCFKNIVFLFVIKEFYFLRIKLPAFIPWNSHAILLSFELYEYV